MNPYLLLAISTAWVASIASAGWVAYGAGQDSEIAARAREATVAKIATDAATAAAAKAIAGIKVTNTTIRQETEHEVQTRTVYADCRHSREQLQRINAALTGRPEPTGDRKLPGADAPVGSVLRSDDAQADRGGWPVP